MIEKREFIHSQTAFDPEAIQMLVSALDIAWDRIQKSGSRFARPAYARAMREVLAKRIIEVAQRGEKDKRKLAADAVKFLAANYMDNNVGGRTAAKRGGSKLLNGAGHLIGGSTHDGEDARRACIRSGFQCRQTAAV
jgi:hypothetical protein